MLVVDALGWRRVLGVGTNIQPPDALLSRGLEVHPFGTGRDLEVWIDRSYVPAGYGWRFPADGELRIGVGSFDPRYHVKEPTVQLARTSAPTLSATRATGSPMRCATGPRTACSSSATRPATACRSPPRGSAPRCTSGSPAAASCARSSTGVQSREQALARYHAFSASHAFAFGSTAARAAARARASRRDCSPAALRAMQAKRFVDWSFGHYLKIAHPSFVGARRGPVGRRCGAGCPAG